MILLMFILKSSLHQNLLISCIITSNKVLYFVVWHIYSPFPYISLDHFSLSFNRKVLLIDKKIDGNMAKFIIVRKYSKYTGRCKSLLKWFIDEIRNTKVTGKMIL